MSRSGKCCQHLNFGLNRTKGVKAKQCWALSTNFLFSVQYKADPKQNMVFSAKSWMGAKIQILFKNYWSLTRFHVTRQLSRFEFLAAHQSVTLTILNFSYLLPKLSTQPTKIGHIFRKKYCLTIIGIKKFRKIY